MLRLAAALLLCAVAAGLAGCNRKTAATSADEPQPGPQQWEPARDGGEKFAALGEWQQVGDVKVRITKAAVGKPVIISGGEAIKDFAKEPELMLAVEVQNASPNKMLTYKRWGSLSLHGGASLADEHGNAYKPSAFGNINSGRVDGAIEGREKDVRPGETITDVICFQRPVDAAAELRLTLAPVRPDAKGEYRFRLRAADWK